MPRLRNAAERVGVLVGLVGAEAGVAERHEPAVLLDDGQPAHLVFSMRDYPCIERP